MKLLLAVLLLLWTCMALGQSTRVCDPRSFGAKGDGVTLDTTAVSAAIAACAAQGGGTVYFAPGRYVIGTVQLASHIRLELESGAVLVGSRDITQYLASPPFGFARNYGVDTSGEGALLGMLIAKDAEDIVIEGQGAIEGSGNSFMGMRTPHAAQDYAKASVRDPEKFEAAMGDLEYGPIEPNARPGVMVIFFHCKNVRVHGITLRDAPNWTMHLQDVEGASISGIQILNDQRVPNNDGIDCMQCHHVRISDCAIVTGDDDLAIVNSENVTVTNCSLSSRSAAIRLESTQLATFTGLTMDTNRGIAIFATGSPGQGVRPTENVIFSNMAIRTRLIPGVWWGKAEPIYIAVQPCVDAAQCAPRVRNVVFNNIEAVAESGSLLWGADGAPIVGVELNNVRLHMVQPNPDFSAAVGGNLDLRWTAASVREAVVRSDIPALFARKVEGLSLHNVSIDWADAMPAYFSDGVRVEQFRELTIDGLTVRQAQASIGAAIFLRDGGGVSITGSRALPGTQTFLQMEGVTDRRVFVNYDLSGAETATRPAGTRFRTQIGVTGHTIPAKR